MRSHFLAILLVTVLGMPGASAQTNNAHVLLTRAMLLSRRAELQTSIHSEEQRFRRLDRDRNDKLEELEQLYSACRAVNPRYSFSKDVSTEMASQSARLNAIQKERSDCLEELDCLYAGLSRLNGDIADCDKAVR